MLYFLENLRNSFDFFLRNKINFSRKNYTEKGQDLSGIFSDVEQKNIYECLKHKYNTVLLENATRTNFIYNVYYLNVFDRYFSKKTGVKISALDIGSKNWSYVKSEYLFFKSFAEEFSLNGIELDAYRLYYNFFTRYEVAKFHTKDLENTAYIAGDFLQHEQKYDYVIWMLPFITKYPLVKWGLPLNYFKPEEMLKHAYELLNTNGELLIINQGEEEYQIQHELNTELGISAEYYGEIKDNFNLFENKRFCTKITKI